MERTYWLQRPWTYKSGPGHKVHLCDKDSPTRSTALCNVQANALKMETVWWQRRLGPLTFEQAVRSIAQATDNSKLCRNCESIALRTPTDSENRTMLTDEGD